MTHPSDLSLSTYADGALPEIETAELELHLQGCEQCRTKVALVVDEARLISQALEAEQLAFEETLPGLEIPAFKRPAGLREFALANLATALVIWLAGFLWKTLFGELVMNAASWATSIYAPDTYDVVSTAILHYLQEGTAMLDAYLGFIVAAIVTGTAAWLLLMLRKNRAGPQLCLGLGVCAIVSLGGTYSQPAHALELRSDTDVVTIAESETINDTLFAGAETVLVKGNVTGDLLVAGKRVEVDGSVGGNLIAFAESVVVRGSVGGVVLGASSRFDLEGATAEGNLFAAAEEVTVDAASSVADNVGIAGNRAVVDGPVGKDLYTFAETVELDSALGGNLEAFGNRVRLLDNARVAGSARLRVEGEDKLHRADGAQIAGALEFLDLPEDLRETSEYASAEFYLWQLARIVSAVLAGLVLLWFFPALRDVVVGGGMEGARSAGVGVLALFGIPIIAVLAGITLVGLPFAFFALVCWILLLYLAKIVIGIFIGRTVLGSTQYADNTLLILLAGITIIILVVNVPLIGGLISFVLTLIGMGLLVQRFTETLRERRLASD